jgi:hypothetical protein
MTIGKPPISEPGFQAFLFARENEAVSRTLRIKTWGGGIRNWRKFSKGVDIGERAVMDMRLSSGRNLNLTPGIE